MYGIFALIFLILSFFLVDAGSTLEGFGFIVVAVLCIDLETKNQGK